MVWIGTAGCGCASTRPALPVTVVSVAAVSSGGRRVSSGGRLPPDETRLADEQPERQPDGVVIEPAPALPDPEERVVASGVVALRAPLGSEAVATVVHRLFRAFAHGDADALQAILTEDAVALGPGHGRGPLLEQWRSRLKNPANARWLGAELVDAGRIVRFGYDDLGVAGAPDRPAVMKPGDILVRFPVATPRAGTDALFGDEMTLLLRREGQVFKIAGASEEDAP